MKIAITTSSFAEFSEEPLRLLDNAGINHTLNPFGRKLTEDETIAQLDGCVGVAAGTEQWSARVMKALPALKVISRCGAGMDNVDMAAAENLGIAVCNTPHGPTLAVAELTLGLALALLRHIPHMDREMRRGVWKKRMGYNLKGKRLGIVGFGRIGRAVADLLAPLGVETAFSDPVAASDVYPGMSLDQLTAWCDMLTLHCSKPSGGGAVIDRRRLGKMKKGAYIINAARGGVLDETALYELLASGHIAGAAVDVFMREPYDGPLKELDNVILTPHIGSYAMESRIQMEIDTVTHLIEALNA